MSVQNVGETSGKISLFFMWTVGSGHFTKAISMETDVGEGCFFTARPEPGFPSMKQAACGACLPLALLVAEVEGAGPEQLQQGEEQRLPPSCCPGVVPQKKVYPTPSLSSRILASLPFSCFLSTIYLSAADLATQAAGQGEEGCPDLLILLLVSCPSGSLGRQVRVHRECWWASGAGFLCGDFTNVLSCLEEPSSAPVAALPSPSCTAGLQSADPLVPPP